MKIPLFLMMLAAPVLAQHRADSILVLADNGGLANAEVHAIVGVTASALRQRGVSVSETTQVQQVDESLLDLGARRIFVLRITGRLGAKIPMSLEEIDARSLAPIFSATLTATGIEECDTVAGRLAEAVVSRSSPASTAEMTSVTAQESKPFAKKPGERFFFIGLPIALYNSSASGSPFGFSLGYGYEAENFRIEASGGGFSRGGDGATYLTLSAYWIPLATEVSPYFGGGLGYMYAGDHGGTGATLEGGLEFFRLHGVRVLAGIQVLVPFFTTDSQTTSNRSIYPDAFVRFAF
jgi:hypothetical protein